MGLQWMDLPCESVHDLAVDGACIRSNAIAVHVRLGCQYIIPDCMRLRGHGNRRVQDRHFTMVSSPCSCACLERPHRIDHIVYVFDQCGGYWVGRSMGEHSVTTISVVCCTWILSAGSFGHCLYVPLPAPTRQKDALHVLGQDVACIKSCPPVTLATSITRRFAGR